MSATSLVNVAELGALETKILLIQPDMDWPARRFLPWLEQQGIEIELVRPFLGEPIPQELTADGLIVLAGYMNVYADDSYPWVPDVRRLYHQADKTATPVLGVCFGAQLLATTFGGEVSLDAPLGPEIGVVEAHWTPEGQIDDVVGGLSQPFLAGAFHDDAISQLPSDAVRLAAGNTYPVQAFRRGAAVGLQFHPEATPEIFREWSEVALRRCPWLEELIRAKVQEFERLDAVSMEEKQALVNNFIDSVRHTQARKNPSSQTPR